MNVRPKSVSPVVALVLFVSLLALTPAAQGSVSSRTAEVEGIGISNRIG